MVNILAVCYSVAFGVVSLACMFEIYKSYLIKRKGRLGDSGAAGWKYRTYLHVFLLLGNIGQAIAFGLQVSKWEDTYSWKHPVGLWYVIILTAPSLLFLSAFSIVLQFWTSLLYVNQPEWLPTIKHTLFGFNATVYLLFSLLLLLGFLRNDALLFEEGSSVLTAVCQLLLASLSGYVGLSLYRKISPGDAQRERRDAESRRNVGRRILVLCFIIVQALIMRSIFSILVAVHVIRIADSNGSMKIRVAAVTTALCELLPSVAILVSTRVKNTGGGRGERRELHSSPLLVSDDEEQGLGRGGGGERGDKLKAGGGPPRTEPFHIYHGGERERELLLSWSSAGVTGSSTSSGGGPGSAERAKYHTFKDFTKASPREEEKNGKE